MNKYLKMIGFYLMILVIIILAVSFLNPMQSEVKDLTYSQLMCQMANKEKAEIKINGSTATGKLVSGDEFSAVVPEYTIDTEVSKYILDNPDMKVEIAEDQSWWVSLFPSAILIVMLVVFLVMMSQQSGGGGKVMSFGKSKARMHTDSDKKVTFANVAGADEE